LGVKNNYYEKYRPYTKNTKLLLCMVSVIIVSISISDGLFYPSSIVTSGSDIYITGYVYTKTPSYKQLGGVYWKNGTVINVSNSSSVSAIAVNGTNIYLFGIDINNNYTIWKNGILFKGISKN